MAIVEERRNLMTQNVWGVGRNFKDHAAEMKAEVPKSPLIFLKSGASINYNSPQIKLPTWAQDVHHEVELAVKITKDGVPTHGTIALDLTERHYQSEAKKKGHPWTLAKSFTGATVLGAWHPWQNEFLSCPISLFINGEVRQNGSMNDLIFSLKQITDFLIEHFPVCDGDVVLMGTPAGVGSLRPTDRIQAKLGDFVTHNWTVTK